MDKMENELKILTEQDIKLVMLDIKNTENTLVEILNSQKVGTPILISLKNYINSINDFKEKVIKEIGLQQYLQLIK